MSRTLSRSEFDYSSLSKELRGKLVSLANCIRKHTEHQVQHTLSKGRELLEAIDLLAKARCEYVFKDWVENTCHISVRTAYNYISAYERFGDYESLAHNFTLEGLYLLAAESTPEESVQTAINLAEKGEKITRGRACELIRRHKENGHDRGDAGSNGDGGEDGSGAASPRDQEAPQQEAGPALGAGADQRESPCVGDLEVTRLQRSIDAAFKTLASDLDLLNKLQPWHDHEAVMISIDIAFSSYRKWKREAA